MYCQQSDIENVFGAANIAKWADMDNTGDPVEIASRIAAAIAWATAEIEDRLRGGPYLIPLTATPPTIVNLCAQLAGVWLYESRGVQEFNVETGEPCHRLQWNRRAAETALAEIRAGKRRLDSSVSPAGVGAAAPFAIRQHKPHHGVPNVGPFGLGGYPPSG
jgi:phage gp36-like protein